MTYLTTSINDSPVITKKASAEADYRGKAIKLSAGKAAICSAAGEAAIGIGIMYNDATVEADGDVVIQVKDIGLVLSGGSITAGDELTADTSGKLVKATADGQYVIAVALEDASGADKFIQAQLVKYPKHAAG